MNVRMPIEVSSQRKNDPGMWYCLLGRRNTGTRRAGTVWYGMVEVYLWETVIQTPYVVSFTAEQAMTETRELFARDENGEWLIGKLGIRGEYNGKYEEMLADRRYATWKDYNIIVEKTFNANAKAGYWEIIITHTKPLDNIGTELL